MKMSLALLKIIFSYLFIINFVFLINYLHPTNSTNEDLLRPVKNGLDFETEAGKHESTRKETHARLVR